MFGLVALLALGVRALAGQVENDSSTLQQITGVMGTAVSGVFLYIIGDPQPGRSWSASSRCSAECVSGAYDEEALEEQLNNRGFMNRFSSGATRAVTKPWQMYPSVCSSGSASTPPPRWACSCLLAARRRSPAVVRDPDAADLVCGGHEPTGHDRRLLHELRLQLGLSKPVRKVYYNITITGLSVAVALIIGTIELISILTEKTGITTGPLAAIANASLDDVGYAIVILFVMTWLIAITIWKYGRIEEKWSAGLQG